MLIRRPTLKVSRRRRRSIHRAAFRPRCRWRRGRRSSSWSISGCSIRGLDVGRVRGASSRRLRSLTTRLSRRRHLRSGLTRSTSVVDGIVRGFGWVFVYGRCGICLGCIASGHVGLRSFGRVGSSSCTALRLISILCIARRRRIVLQIQEASALLAVAERNLAGLTAGGLAAAVSPFALACALSAS